MMNSIIGWRNLDIDEIRAACSYPVHAFRRLAMTLLREPSAFFHDIGNIQKQGLF